MEETQQAQQAQGNSSSQKRRAPGRPKKTESKKARAPRAPRATTHNSGDTVVSATPQMAIEDIGLWSAVRSFNESKRALEARGLSTRQITALI